MPQERDVKLDQYRISQNAYRELKYFCRQYSEWKEQLISCYGITSPMPSETPRGGCTRDSVSRQAENAIKLKSSIELIEQTVLEVAGKALYKPLLLNVTEGIAYEYLGKVPCGRRQFYEIRQKFFYTLSKKRG